MTDKTQTPRTLVERLREAADWCADEEQDMDKLAELLDEAAAELAAANARLAALVACFDDEGELREQFEDQFSVALEGADKHIRALAPQSERPADGVVVPVGVFKELEWGSWHYSDNGYGEYQKVCPICGNEQRQGHAKDCALLAAAKEPRK